jgi:hypothetical protein
VISERVMTTGVHVLRPHRHLLSSGVIAALALTTPLFAVAYWLTISAGTWPYVAIAHVLVAVALLFAVLQYRRTTLIVSADGIRERGFLGRVTELPNSEIGTLCLVELYRDNALDTQPNLFILDTTGSPRVRLRGQYWSRMVMEDVAEVLDRPLIGSTESITLSEMRTIRPGWLYWFERTPFFSWF